MSFMEKLKKKFRPKTTEELEKEYQTLLKRKEEMDKRRELIRKINELKRCERQALRRWSWDWKEFDKMAEKMGKFADGLGAGLDQVLLGQVKEKVERGENN